MNKTIVITEGKFDSMVLSKILEYLKPKHSYKIENAEGYSSALSKAKSYLSLNNKVALVTDSDSILEAEITERKQFIKSYVNIRNEDVFRSILIVPEFEVLFVENGAFVEKYLSIYKNSNLINTIKFSPKKVIESHLKIRREKLIDMMSDEVLKGFKDNKYIVELVNFINGM